MGSISKEKARKIKVLNLNSSLGSKLYCYSSSLYWRWFQKGSHTSCGFLSCTFSLLGPNYLCGPAKMMTENWFVGGGCCLLLGYRLVSSPSVPSSLQKAYLRIQKTLFSLRFRCS